MPKGQSVLGYKGLYFIFALFLLTFMFLYPYTTFAKHSAEKVQCVDTALQEIIIAKFLYSSCFTYEDTEIQQNLPGTVDLSKFKQENLDVCFNYLKKKVNISVEGKTIGEEIDKPVSIRKTTWVYENGEKRPSTIQFIFEESTC